MYINYSVFVRLYKEAEEETDIDRYIAERGWQDWMDSADSTEEVVAFLTAIYEIAHSDFSELRRMLGISQVEMIRTYNIPTRTLKNWEYGEREPANHVKMLLAYAVIMEALNRGCENL